VIDSGYKSQARGRRKAFLSATAREADFVVTAKPLASSR
jgi:hypothetical protein